MTIFSSLLSRLLPAPPEIRPGEDLEFVDVRTAAEYSSGHAPGAQDQPPTGDHRAADAGSQRQEHHVLHVPGHAELELRPAGRVRVVLHDDRQVEAQTGRDAVPQRVVPPRQVRREPDGRLVRSDEPGRGQPDRAHRVRGGELRTSVGDRGVERLDLEAPALALGLGDDPALFVDYTGGDLGAPDVHSDCVHVRPRLVGPPVGAGARWSRAQATDVPT